MCDGKRGHSIDSKRVAAAPACRVVSSVSSSGKWGVAREGFGNRCRGKAAAGGWREGEWRGRASGSVGEA